MRIALYTDSTAVGGAERSAANLLGALPAEIDVTVVGTDHRVVTAIRAQRPQASSILLPLVRAPWDAVAVRAHLRTIRALDVDLLQTNCPRPWACEYAVLAALLPPRTQVLEVFHAPTPPDRAREAMLKRWLARRTAAHVAVGSDSASRLDSLLQLSPGSTKVIPNGVPDVVPPASERDTSSLRIGWAGRLEREKGVDVLLRALSLLPDAQAVLVGDGPLREELESDAKRLGVADRVTFTGWIEEPRVVLRTCDIFALPSRSEALPLAVIEAMLVELPVVASAVGDLGDLVDDATDALVAADGAPALAAALGRLLVSPDLRRELGRAGRERALAEFTPAAAAAAFVELWEQVAGQGRPRRNVS
jgi:L-malate glycosyltransferase